MVFLTNHSLTPYHTFGLDVRTAFFVEIKSTEELRHALAQSTPPILLLGGGSNMLLTRDWPGTVIHMMEKGREISSENEEEAIIAAGAGENWHELVLWTLDQHLGGLENLSLIPGSVGAAPIQNIGAYGVELTDVFDHLEAMDLETGVIRVFDHDSCHFGYRDSVFKNEYKGKYAITRVFLRLKKNPVVNTGYGAIRDLLSQEGITTPTIRDVSRAVIGIRRSKLPDPAVLGNAGSFFKNPEVSAGELQRLLEAFPHLIHYPLPDGGAKIPAGWLIEQCGWKGKRVGNTGCHAQQSLVLVNYGGATGQEIWAHAQRVAQSVKETFGVELMAEVNVL
ncbi:MAG: UDP-N-acetylmuramate dehydrogenase [Saprospirales bacterium]|nr:UDP-N-acetylmuramate dehydrogenase [Saprospirales bacterium]MBK8490359.1 UDP-N-acetylmuramate dehydrogenase [Saprospirales bacterium]